MLERRFPPNTTMAMAKLPILITTIYIADLPSDQIARDSESVLEGPPAARIASDITP
jgi:hypothetical protein